MGKTIRSRSLAGGGDIVVGRCVFSSPGWSLRKGSAQPDEAAWRSLPGEDEKSKQRDVCSKDCLQHELGNDASNSQQHGGCEQVCWHAGLRNTQQARWWAWDLKAIGSNPWMGGFAQA